ncbi:hypothetical protein VTI74DRAFT_11544 [Chaetomium olivicolor]
MISNHDAKEAVAAENTRYRALLNRVVVAARTATFPPRGTFDMSALLNTLPGDDDIHMSDVLDAINLSSPSERDEKIGAAGELYVSLLPRPQHYISTCLPRCS